MANELRPPPTAADNISILRRLAGRTSFKTSPKLIDAHAAQLEKYLAAMRRLEQIGMDRLREGYEQAARTAGELVLDGHLDQVRSAAIAKPELAERWYAERRSIKGGLRLLTNEALDLVRPEFERFVQSAASYLDKLQGVEAQEAAAWGLPYSPGPVVLAVRNAVDFARHFLPESGQGFILRPDFLIWL